MGVIDRIRAQARASLKTIVLPEGDEPRTVAAAEIVAREGIARPILLTSDRLQDRAADYAAALYELRKAKGLTPEGARKLVADPMYYGMMMVQLGEADGLVSGAVHSTGDMLRPALQIVKTKPGMKLVSSSFIIEGPWPQYGADGLLVYADCVVNPAPTEEQRQDIARAAAETARNLCGIAAPRVAMLGPDLPFDAALDDGANVFVFPDLQAGNICYKITQRLGGGSGFAVLQGLAKPCNDLSRGCSVDDIVDTIAITAVQAQKVV